MSDIAKVVEQCLIINGDIQVRPYSASNAEYLKSLMLWSFIRSNKHQFTIFSDDSWYSQGNKLAITFVDLTDEFKYQLKALTLGMYTQGKAEGMDSLSWLSIRMVISNLKRLAKWLQQYNIYSFTSIQKLPELKLRNIITELVQYSNLQKHPSFAQSILTAIYWLKLYGMVDSTLFFKLMSEYFMPFSLLKKERRNKHSIIPIQIMKQVLKISERQVIDAEKVLGDWLALQNKVNAAISNLPSSEFRRTTHVKALNKEENEQLNSYYYKVKNLRRYTFVLILSYTGMRLSEVMALSDDAAINHNGQFYLRSLLSKTTDETQSLEWITNEIVYKAVSLMGTVNQVYRERALLILKHHGLALPPQRKINLEFGLTQNMLFGVLPHKKSCEFILNTKLTNNSFNQINSMFSIPLSEEDVSELVRMGCNYQSVSSNHKHFKKTYQIGDYFNFTPHQFRHTFAWFIVANRLGDLDDIKYQYKHIENMMTLVYSQRGYESMEDFIRLTDSFSEFMMLQTMDNMVTAAQNGTLAGKGGQNFILKLTEILSDDLTTGSAPHFSNIQELLAFVAKHTNNFRGLSHGYCTKGGECKVRNAADPSHCVSCDSYIATPRHLPHWIVIKNRCESQLAGFEQLPSELKQRFKAFSTALENNLEAANIIINQLTITVKEA